MASDSSSVVQLVVDDTSPAVVYTPFGDTLSTPDVLAGWNPYYSTSGFASSQGQVGIGTSSHITSLDGAVLSLQWHGTNIQLFGNIYQANYTISLDGALQSNFSFNSTLLASFSDLENVDHTIALTFHPSIPASNSSYIAFDKALITLPGPQLTPSAFFQAIDNSYISYNGLWTTQPSQGQDGTVNSVHQSTTKGDRAAATFQGSAFQLTGITSPTAATYTVILAPITPNSNSPSLTKTFSARSSFLQDSTLLFYATGLNESEIYSIEVFNIDGGLLSLDTQGFEVLGYREPLPAQQPENTGQPHSSGSNSYPPGTIAALALSGILLFFFISSLLFYFLFWRPRSRRNSIAQRIIKPPDHEAGDIIIVQREKYIEHPDDVVHDPFPPTPGPDRSKRQRTKLDNVSDSISFRFPFVRKGKAKADPGKASSARSLSSDPSVVDIGPPPRSPRPGSPSRTSLPVLPPSSRRSADRIRDAQTRPSQLLEPASTQPSVPSTMDESQVPTTSGDSQICGDCRTTDRSAEVDVPIRGQADTAIPRGTPPASLKPSDDQSLEYVDLEYVLNDEHRSPARVPLSSIPAPVPLSETQVERSSRASSEGQQFLEVRTTSPFRVDFPQNSQKPPRTGDPSSARRSVSRVRFQENPVQAPIDADDNLAPVSTNPSSLGALPRRGPLRVARGAVTSFLDLSSTPPDSLRADSSSGSSRSQPQEKSRWSTTTASQTASAFHSPSNVTSPLSQGDEMSQWSLPTSPRTFPFRFSFLSHPRTSRSESRRARSSVLSSIAVSPQDSPSQSHPFRLSDAAALHSPTHSVPTTISDLHFRHSRSISDEVSRVGSRRASTGSHLPPHPPLPSGESDHQRERSSTSQLSTSLLNRPSIVQRVLGLQNPAGGSQPSLIGRDTSMSGSSSTMSPGMGRRFRS